MIDKTIIEKIKLWIKDFEELGCRVDYNTFESDAYLIFKDILKEIKK